MSSLTYGELISDTELTPKKAQTYFVNINTMSDEEMKAAAKEILTQGPTVAALADINMSPEDIKDFITYVQERPSEMRHVITYGYTGFNNSDLLNDSNGKIDGVENLVLRGFLRNKLGPAVDRFHKEQAKAHPEPQKQGFFQKAAECVSKTVRRAMFGPARTIGTGEFDNVKTSYNVRNNNQNNNSPRKGDYTL